MDQAWPIEIIGKVVCGFSRGNEQLNIPTANICSNDVQTSLLNQAISQLDTGIYYGYVKIITKDSKDSDLTASLTCNSAKAHGMVASYGYNPYYKNKEKSLEVHVFYNFEQTFYGATLKCVLLGYIRQERDFESLDAMLLEIENDVAFAKAQLANAPIPPQLESI